MATDILMDKKCQNCHTENPLSAKFCRHCGNKFDDEPEISDFRLNGVCKIGDVVDLSWDITNADKVTLNGVVVTGKTHCSVTIKGDDDFKLIAQKGKNKSERTITVHPQKEPKSAPVSSVSVLKRKKWTVAIGILALAMLLLVHFHENDIPYYFNIGYSKWQDMKPIIKITCWIVILFSTVSIIYSEKRKKKVSL